MKAKELGGKGLGPGEFAAAECDITVSLRSHFIEEAIIFQRVPTEHWRCHDIPLGKKGSFNQVRWEDIPRLLPLVE